LVFYAFSKTPVNELNKLQFKISYDDIIDKKNYDLEDEWSNETSSLSFDSLKETGQQLFNLSVTYKSSPHKLKDTTFTMQVQNVNKKSFESLSSFLQKKKYILIDYWGTWCIPCIEKIPNLKKMKSDFSDKFSLISIAYDYDLNKVSDFEKSHGNDGDSYFIDRNNQRSVIKPLNVQFFPTYRLYDATGKLIYNGQTDPDKDLEKIREILAK
jgi:thiol-disulfide isomerase/thioredoxin